MPELIVILVIALIVLGPSRLPDVAKALGRALAEFRKATSDLTDELADARRMLEDEVRAAERQAAAQQKLKPPEPPAGAPQAAKKGDETSGS
jgi:TatA/E family protein of Tat protein translocase